MRLPRGIRTGLHGNEMHRHETRQLLRHIFVRSVARPRQTGGRNGLYSYLSNRDVDVPQAIVWRPGGRGLPRKSVVVRRVAVGANSVRLVRSSEAVTFRRREFD